MVEAAGVGLPESFDFSNNLNKLNRSIGEIREKPEVQVQNRYSGPSQRKLRKSISSVFES